MFELAVSSQTSGRAKNESHSSGRAAIKPYCSAERSAIDLGTSSPITIDRNDTITTIKPSAISSA